MSQFMLYSNCAGSFIFNNNYKLKDKILCKDRKEITQHCRLLEHGEETPSEKILLRKYKAARIGGIEDGKFQKISKEMEEFIQIISKNNIIVAKNKIRESVKDDLFVVQAVKNIDEIDKTATLLAKRLREWYSYYLPEFSDSIESNEKFTELIISKDKKTLLAEIKLNADESMGAELAKEDLNEVLELAKTLSNMYGLRSTHEKYLEKIMKRLCPNIQAVAGTLIGARLLAVAGSLEKLIRFPASTVQVLGAEKAFFRHLKTGAKPPKYGVIVNHPVVAKAKNKDRGKAARMIADKLAIAAKVDFFKGKFVGDELRKKIEARFK